MRDYEDVLLAHCPGYAEADSSRRADEASVREFFGAGFLERTAFDNAQSFAFDGLLGRVLSSSYAPKPGEAAHEPLRSALRGVFERYAVDGRVTLTYDTILYVGEMH